MPHNYRKEDEARIRAELRSSLRGYGVLFVAFATLIALVLAVLFLTG